MVSNNLCGLMLSSPFVHLLLNVEVQQTLILSLLIINKILNGDNIMSDHKGVIMYKVLYRNVKKRSLWLT